MRTPCWQNVSFVVEIDGEKIGEKSHSAEKTTRALCSFCHFCKYKLVKRNLLRIYRKKFTYRAIYFGYDVTFSDIAHNLVHIRKDH